MLSVNILDSTFRKDPYPTYAAVRATPGLVQVQPGPMWAVSRYDEAVEVFKNTTAFSSQGLRVATTTSWLPNNPLAESIVLFDPPRHTGIRAVVAHAFSNRVLPRIEPLARNFSRSFAARAKSGAVIDVAVDLAMLPAAVIGNLLGYEGDPQRIRQWSECLVAVNEFTPEHLRNEIIRELEALTSCIQSMFADRKQARRDDLASDLLDAEVDGVRLDDAELLGFMYLLIVAGFDTTAHLLSNALRILSSRPALIKRLQNQPDDIPTFLEEVLRFETSVHNTMRVAVQDITIGTTPIAAGSLVVLLLGAINRDESRYTNPEEFDMDRKQRPSISFGHGIHFCLGAPLARAEARIALEEILPQIEGITLVDEPEWNTSMTVRGTTHCRMQFHPRT